MGARLDQHFLISDEVRDAVVAAARLSSSDRVLEIGPGRGMLTRGLLGSAAHVTAVEMDDRLAPRLAEEFAGEPKLRIIHADFLKLDLSELGEGPFTVTANLPYSVATPILQRILPWPHWTTAVLMFQKEVALRVAARPGGADYGLLTLSVLLFAEAELVLEVPRTCFSPPPQVASAVVLLRRRPAPLLPVERQEAFFKIAKAAFGQRRKMAAGPIAAALKVPRERVVGALARRGVGAKARAETIPLAAWLGLPEELG